MPELMASLIGQQSLPGTAYEVIPLKIAGVVHYAVVSNLPLTSSGFTGGFPWGGISDILCRGDTFCAPLLFLSMHSKGQWTRLHPLTNETRCASL